MLHIIRNAAKVQRRRQEGINSYSDYLFDILAYLGVSYTTWDHTAWIEEKPAGTSIVIGGTDHALWVSACRDYVQSGNSLLTVGDSYGLHELFGIRLTGRISEGWIQWGDAPIAEGLRSSFHFFGARTFTCADDELQQYGTLISRNGQPSSTPGLGIRKLGNGTAALLNFDVMKTFCLIQQGLPVTVDGLPAPDGSGAIDEGILKTDDGSVLDWERDRDAVEEVPFYLHPIVDEMRCLLNRLLVRLEHEAGSRIVQKWFWPDGLDAIGHISHDTDGNDGAEAEMMLDWLRRANVKSTWCIIMPGYEQVVNDRIEGEGHEVALHYNALETEIAESSWSEEHFQFQLEMLQAQFPNTHIVSNKNHYLRWEGDVQFYHWCERAGIKVEQSKGGTKRGNKGFLAGTCHPYVPLSHAGAHNRRLDVLSLPTLAWDPPDEMRCSEREAYALLERSREVYGVAHFLLHPGAMGAMPGDRGGELLVKLVELGRSLGMAWWTSEEIGRWCVTRNHVRIDVRKDSTERRVVSIASDDRLQGFTLLLTVQPHEALIIKESQSCTIRSTKRLRRFGCEYTEVILDAEQGTSEFCFLGR